jgi:hypothetical protein
MVLGFNRPIRAVMLLTGILLFGYAFYLKHRSSINKPDNTFANEVITHSVAQDKVPSLMPSDASGQVADQPDTVEAENESPLMALADFQRLMHWDDEHGYYAASDLADYESYNEQTLKDLSASGDVKAMLVLSDYYILKDYRPLEARKYDYKAAVYGATTSFASLATQVHMEMLLREEDKTAEGLERGVIGMMAYYKVAAMRGDPRSRAHINAFKTIYKQRYKTELVLTQEQLDKIDIKAKAIYDELQQERYALGLGDFDNSTHESIKKDYSIK